MCLDFCAIAMDLCEIFTMGFFFLSPISSDYSVLDVLGPSVRPSLPAKSCIRKLSAMVMRCERDQAWMDETVEHVDTRKNRGDFSLPIVLVAHVQQSSSRNRKNWWKQARETPRYMSIRLT